MFRRCLSCHRPFEANDVVETMPLGRRVAFDAERGRLWTICDGCRRWTLAPIEERWETLEELERMTRDGGRLLRHTDNIALFENGPMQVVRVGRAGLRETAWWRFGHELLKRRKRADRTVRRGKVLEAIFALMLTGLPIWGWRDPERWIEGSRRRHFGLTAWKGRAACPCCGRIIKRVGFRDELHLEQARTDLVLVRSCRACGWAGREGGYVIGGTAATHTLRRLLAYRNFAGADAAGLGEGVSVVERAGSADAVLRRAVDRRIRPHRMRPADALALEIALNETTEARLLDLELGALETRWREEEELAAIIDGELTPPR